MIYDLNIFHLLGILANEIDQKVEEAVKDDILQEQEAYTQIEPENILPLTNDQEGMFIYKLNIFSKNLFNGSLKEGLYFYFIITKCELNYWFKISLTAGGTFRLCFSFQ